LFFGSAFDNWAAKNWPVGQTMQHIVDPVLLHSLPPGEYIVRVKVTNRQTGQAQAKANGQDKVEATGITVE
jgi:hypothetical protein